MPQNFISMDHGDIMDSLVLFLKSQDEFKDFNFDGSAIRELIRVLSYNAQQQSFQNNFIFNELQADSAQIRANLTSLVSRLGYVPSSKRAAKINVDIVVVPSNLSVAPSSIIMTRDTSFYATKDGSAYTFSPSADYTATLFGGSYRFSNVTLLQGVWAINAFPVQVSNGVESYILPNLNIDTTTLEVYVRDSETSSDQTLYNRFQTAYDLGENSSLYFIRENRQGFFEFKFGDGKFAKKLNFGNIITTRYLVTDGDAGNNLSSVTPASSISGYYNIQIIKNDDFSYGGSAEEDIESIRTLAPLSFVASDNAVTAGDHVSIIKKIFSEARDVIAWGGEDNDPPKYGYTFVSVKPTNSEILTASEKSDLITLIKKYNVGSISPIIADPEYTYVNIDTTVKYDPKYLSLTTNALKSKIIDSCKAYSADKMEKFGGALEVSRFSEFLNNIDPSIVGNFNKITYEKHISVIVNTTASYTVKFNHQIKPGTVKITGFTVADTYTAGALYSIVDNTGVLQLVRTSIAGTSVLNPNAGTVDYTNGTISITKFRPNTTNGSVSVVAEPDIYGNIDASILAFNNLILSMKDINVTLIVGSL